MDRRSNHVHEPLIDEGAGAENDEGAGVEDGEGAGAEGAGGSVIIVRYFAGARAAAGVAEERVASGLTLDALAIELTGRHGERLGPVLKVASFLVDGRVCRDRDAVLPAGATVDVLPPFAGG